MTPCAQTEDDMNPCCSDTNCAVADASTVAAGAAASAAAADHSATNDSAVLFFDIDGTLIYRDAEAEGDEDFAAVHPTNAVFQAFDRLRDAGHKAFICTGRPVCLVTGEMDKLAVAGMVASAGAVVVLDGEVVHEQLIDVDLLEKTVEVLAKTDVPILFEGTRTCVVLSTAGVPLTGFTEFPHVRNFAEMREAVSELRFCKFSFLSNGLDGLDDAMPVILEHYSICNLGVGAYEASLRGVDKGAGVKRALELLGDSTARTYGFGDSENDLAMLRAVDVSVAMGNALDSVKEIASYVTDPVQDDGVVTAMEHFGLI